MQEVLRTKPDQARQPGKSVSRAAEAKTLFLKKGRAGLARGPYPYPAPVRPGPRWEAVGRSHSPLPSTDAAVDQEAEAGFPGPRSTELFSACGRRMRNPLVACEKRERAWGRHPCSVSKTWPES